jgi:hypothetical protein
LPYDAQDHTRLLVENSDYNHSIEAFGLLARWMVLCINLHLIDFHDKNENVRAQSMQFEAQFPAPEAVGRSR